jgi:hypothetical protein
MSFFFFKQIHGRFLGMNGEELICYLFSISQQAKGPIVRKTVKNWISGKHRPSQGAKSALLNSFSQKFPTTDKALSLLETNLFGIDLDAIPDDAVFAPWSYFLPNLERSFFQGYFKGETYDSELFIFPEASLEELKPLEEQTRALHKALCRDDIATAVQLLNGSLGSSSLFQQSFMGVTWQRYQDNPERLKAILGILMAESFIYIYTLLDFSLGREEEGFRETPKLKAMIPILRDGSWVMPLSQWFDEFKLETKSDTWKELARKMVNWGGNQTYETHLRYLAHWRKGNRFETPKAFELIQSAYAADEESFDDIKMTGRFIMARMFHGYHEHMLDSGMSDEILVEIYNKYDYWYSYHYQLNAEPPQQV